MNTRALKQFKYFSKGLIKGEYPKRELTRVRIANETLFDNELRNSKLSNCFITWKTNRLTRTHANAYQAFIDINVDFQFIFFDDYNMSSWMSNNCSDKDLVMIYKNLNFSASRADVFRLAVLCEYGGVYTSINRVFTTPISNVVKDHAKFAITFERFKYLRSSASKKLPLEFRECSVVQHTIAAPAGHQILLEAIEEIKREAHRHKGRKFLSVKEAIWQFTASLMLTRAVDKYLDSTNKGDYEFLGFEFNDSVVIPKGSEYRYACSPSYLGSKNKVVLNTF